MTLRDLAEACHTTQTSISRIERGVQPYTQGSLEAIARALRCRPSDLLSRAPGASDQILKVLDTMSPDAQARAVAMLELLMAPNDNSVGVIDTGATRGPTHPAPFPLKATGKIGRA